ncbi:MAG: hypothetical protein LBU67_02230 [Oscillospiraceae bacterium]|nr:hypothetical protein [Oscillospiraceae bacterium]
MRHYRAAHYRAWMARMLGGIAPGARALFIALDVFLSVYITFVAYTMDSQIFTTRTNTALALGTTCVFAALLFHGLLALCHALRNRGAAFAREAETFPWRTFCAVAGACFLVFILALLAYGGMSEDTETQWQQVQSGQFSDWHPAGNTLLLWLIAQAARTYSATLSVLILAFSLALGYLVAVLRRWGLRAGGVAAVACFLVLNHSVRDVLLYLKDGVMTIFLTALMGMVLNIYFSDGRWLARYRNLVACGLMMAMTTLMRHNAFFFTGPLLLLVLLAYGRTLGWRRGAALLAVAAGLLAGIQGPLFTAVGVERNPGHQTYVESIGMPMTILADAYYKDRDSMPPDARQQMEAYAPEAVWAMYNPGDYNSIKFITRQGAINMAADLPVGPFLSMAWRTAKACPRIAFEAVRELTRMAWQLPGPYGVQFRPSPRGESSAPPLPSDHPLRKAAAALIEKLDQSLNIQAYRWVSETIGLQMLCLMLLGLWAVYRMGWRVLLLVAPTVAYNLGTMLLLCGPDYRFFHFNLVLNLPLCLALCARAGRADAAGPAPRANA